MFTSLLFKFDLQFATTLLAVALLANLCPAQDRSNPESPSEGTKLTVQDEKSDDDNEDKPAADKAQETTSDDDSEQKNGQANLDKAFELKITATSTRDLDKVADLCESAIENGLERDSEEQAKELWASVLYNHARQLNRRIAPNGTLSTRWRWLRQQAVSRLDKAIELRPGKIDALIMLAKLHSLDAGNKDAAIAAIEKAIAQLTDDKEKLSQALYIRARLAEDEKSRIADLTQSVKINPENFEALMERATYFLRAEKSDEAMKDFKSLLAIEKDNIARYIIIAQSLRQRRMFKESAEILTLAIEQNDQDDNLFMLRGQAYLADQNDESALEDFNQALDINRRNIEALNLRCRAYIVKEDYEKALQDANELIQQKPNDPDGVALRSLVYRSQGNFEKAIEDTQLLLEDDPSNLDYKFDIAILHTANNAPSKAIPIYDEIISQLPDSAQSQIIRNRGDAYLSLGKHERAIDDFELALELLREHSGSDADAMSDEREKSMLSGLLNNLAWVLSTSTIDELRDGKRALKLALEASELTEYKEAFILSTLASAYAETGDFELARKWATKAVELAESDEQRIGLQEELESFKKDEKWREIENVEEENKKELGDSDKEPKGDSDKKVEPKDDDESDSSEHDDKDDQSNTRR